MFRCVQVCSGVCGSNSVWSKSLHVFIIVNSTYFCHLVYQEKLISVLILIRVTMLTLSLSLSLSQSWYPWPPSRSVLASAVAEVAGAPWQRSSPATRRPSESVHIWVHPVGPVRTSNVCVCVCVCVSRLVRERLQTEVEKMKSHFSGFRPALVVLQVSNWVLYFLLLLCSTHLSDSFSESSWNHKLNNKTKSWSHRSVNQWQVEGWWRVCRVGLVWSCSVCCSWSSSHKLW